jgi:hypothetical protein
MGIAAPIIVSEMNDWTALGGGNSGIVGNPLHTYGFHLAASELLATDYSRAQDPNGPHGPYVDWSYCCAGDFAHSGNPNLRAMHAKVLTRLMNGEMPMVCEFIGQPYADQPVLYWARWNGIKTLQQYTGEGHDMWSHISWYRSTVDQRANLWTSSTLQPTTEDKMITIVPTADPNVFWKCDGMFISKMDSEQLSHLRYIAAQGAITLWKNPATGSDLWDGGIVPAFGVDIATLQGSGGGVATAVKLTTEGVQQVEDAAFRGANRAEDS